MVLVTSHGFRGAYVGSRHSVSDDGDRRRRHRHGARLRLHLGAARRRSRSGREDRPQRRRARGESGSIRARSRPGASRSCSTRASPVRWSGIWPRAINGASIARKTSFLKDRMGERLFRAGIRIVDDPLRPRGLRSRPFDGEGVAGRELAVIEDGVLDILVPRFSATARELGLTTTGHASRGVSSSPSPSPTNLHLEAGRAQPAGADRRHRGRLLRHRPDRHGRQPRHRRLQPRRLGILDRERRAHLSGERGDDRRATSTTCSPRSTPANDLEFRYGTNAPTVRVEGLTVAGT